MTVKERIKKLFVGLATLIRLFLYVLIYSMSKLLPGRLREKFHPEKFLKNKRRDSDDIEMEGLVELAFKQVFHKRSRAYITIGAISMAMGIIILLVSLGYGAQRVIIDRVANDKELLIIDTLPEPGKKVELNPDLVSNIKKYDKVENVMPVIGVVGKLEYDGSEGDVVAYGTTRDYLQYSEMLGAGEFFESNEIPSKRIQYNVEDLEAEKRQIQNGGDDVQSEISVLAGEDAELEFIDIGSEEFEPETYIVSNLDVESDFETVVNRRVLSTMGIEPNEAIGTQIKLTFILVEDLLGGVDYKIKSAPITYTIIGVSNDDTEPILYVPIEQIWALGTVKFSQARVVVEDDSDVTEIRERLQSVGLITKSIQDTITQIEDFFDIARIVLVVIGLGALVIASLGVFNTLTVSLLERSKEVGLLKVLGMKSGQIYNLFIAESLVMGVWGGIGGIIIAFVGGKVISLLLSLFTVSRGGEWVDISYIPLGLLAFSIGLIILVGVFTGFYPARRATRISALDALRYE